LADCYAPLAANPQLRKRFSARLLAAIDAGLAVRPQARPQSIAAFRQLLGLGEDAAAALLAPSAATQRAEPAIAEKARKAAAPRGKGKDMRRAATAAVLALALLAAGLGWWVLRDREPQGATVPGSETAGTGVSAGQSPTAEEKTPQTPADQTAQAQSSPPTTQKQAPQGPADQTAQAQSSPPVIQKQTPQTAQVPPSPPVQPVTPAESLAALAEGADSEFHVSATPRQQTVRVGKDRLAFEIRSSRAGYVYVYLLSTNGELSLLFPSLLDKHNRIKAGQTLVLPRASWPMLAGGPPGINRFAVLVSKHPRNLMVSGLRNNAIFRKFSLPDLAALEAARGDKPAPLLGKPVCKPRAGCQDIYGVGVFEITEQ